MISSFCSMAEDLQEAYSRTYPYGLISLVPIDGKKAYIQYCYTDKFNSKFEMDKGKYVSFLNTELQKVAEKDCNLFFSTSLSYPPLLLEETSERTQQIVSWTQANNFFSKNLILLGDSAHNFYPYLLQDTNIALGEIAMFTDTVSNHRSINVYDRYARGQCNTYGNLQHFLRCVSQSDDAWAKGIQALGMGLLNACPLTAYLMNEVAHGVIGEYSSDIAKKLGHLDCMIKNH